MPRLDFTALFESPAFEVTALMLGLVVGSFANVCIHRLPRDYEPAAGRWGWLRDLLRQIGSLVHPPSHCPRCGKLIRPWDNVPLLSWLLLRGRCRSCALPISPRYPAVEAANGLLWLAVASVHGPRLQTAIELPFVTALLVLVLVDFEHQLLPDAVTLPWTLIALAWSLLPGSAVRPLDALASAVLGYGAFALLAFVWRRLRGIEALGEGDWKMTAMLGAFLGQEKLLFTLLLASGAGSLVGIAAIALRRGGWQSRLPLGSFLGAAGILVVLWGGPLLAWYRSLGRG